ncbi:MAG: hypothetical protein P1U53_17035 [Sulfitobacter sp.]|nr:hypothetical protein [Sulfitobacter sp.]
MAQWKISGRQAACTICSHPFEDGERHHSMVAFAEESVQRGDFCQACWDKGGPELELQAPEGAEPGALEPEGSDQPESADPQAGTVADEPTAQTEGGTESEGSHEPDSDSVNPADSDNAPGASSEGEAAGTKPHRFWWTTHHQAKPQKTLQMDMDALQRLFLELTDREETNLRELRYVLCLLLMRKKRVKLERILRDDSGESFIVRRPKLDERYTVEVFDFTPERMAEVREHLQAIFDGVDGDESLAQAARGEEEDEAVAEPVAE